MIRGLRRGLSSQLLGCDSDKLTIKTKTAKIESTKPNKTKLALVLSPFTTSGQETDQIHSNKKFLKPARATRPIMWHNGSDDSVIIYKRLTLHYRHHFWKRGLRGYGILIKAIRTSVIQLQYKNFSRIALVRIA